MTFIRILKISHIIFNSRKFVSWTQKVSNFTRITMQQLINYEAYIMLHVLNEDAIMI